MKLSKSQRLMLYALEEFYQQLNQPLETTPLQVRTSKIAFITFLLHSKIITTQKRALYKNLESLEKIHLIQYDYKMIYFTEKGLEIVRKIKKEIQQFLALTEFFQTAEKPKRKLQTIIKNEMTTN